ncbi:hypothetical protein ACQ5SO_17170 [Rhodovulum sp. DZ06]|uniref:hypothetical protein n=1 Tax=Rhodovulum sp. DZ06 TaxID=3425126 RepID=UPI003D32C614
MPSYRLIYTPSLDEPPMIDGIVHAADEVEARSRVPSLGDQLLVLDLSAKLGSDTLREEWMAGERWVEALVERERAGPGNSPRAEALIGSFERAHG